MKLIKNDANEDVNVPVYCFREEEYREKKSEKKTSVENVQRMCSLFDNFFDRFLFCIRLLNGWAFKVSKKIWRILCEMAVINFVAKSI